MNKLFNKLVAVILCLVMVLSLAGCNSSAGLTDPLIFDEKHKNKTSDSFSITYDESAYELLWDSNTFAVSIRNKETGKVYSPDPYAGLTEEELANISAGTENTAAKLNVNHPKLKTNLMIKYIDTETGFEEKSSNGYLYSLKTKTYYLEKTKDGKGFKLIYYFDKLKLSVPVVYTLLDDGIKMTVVPEEISECVEKLITEVSLSPFFCSVPNVDDDAYLFYPSGSGAIIEANNSSDVSHYLSNEVYGNDGLENDYMGIVASPVESIRMPVYGAVDGDSGMLAIITEGAETAKIEGDIGNATLGNSALYTTFKLRGSNIANKVQNGKQFSDQYAYTPMSVCYYPLEGEEASYVGMANRYRKYLEEQGMTDKEEKASANISFVGGTLLQTSFLGVPTTEVFATTTLKDTQKVLTELNSKLQVPIVADLLGYGSSGIDVGKPAGNLTIADTIGSKDDAKKLSAKCKELGIDLYYDYDLIHFNSNGQGLSITSGGAAKGPGHIYSRFYTYRLGDSQRTSYIYHIGRLELENLANKAADNNKSMEIGGISFRKLTSVAYSDYAENRSIAKANMSTDVIKILKNVSEKGLKILGNQANDYAAIYSDAIIDVPVSSSLLSIFDYDVPFYQIVMKGYVPTYGTAINMTTNHNRTILRCIESGAALRFTLINNYGNELLTSGTQIFNSLLYSDNKDEIVATINEHVDYYKAIEDAHIVDHIVINEDVRKVVYDNGVVVYVNYSDEAYESEIGTINPCYYLVGKEVSDNG